MTNTTCVFRPSKVDKIKQLTEELRTEENQLQLFFQLSPDLLCILTPSCRIVKMNKAWEQLGWHQPDCLDRYVMEFVHPGDVAETLLNLRGAQHGQVTRFANRLRCRSGEKYVRFDWSVTAGSDDQIYASARAID